MIFFFWVEKRLTGAVNIISGVSKNRFRQTHHSCNDVEQLIKLLQYVIESKASNHLQNTGLVC